MLVFRVVPLALFVTATIGAVSGLAMEPTKVGSEIVISLPAGQYVAVPRVAADPAGNFMVVWEDDYDGPYPARAQAFYANGNARGPAFTVSTPNQSMSDGDYAAEPLSLAADGGGNFVVAFNAYDVSVEPGTACSSAFYGCAYTRRLDVDGKLSPSVFEIGNPLQNVYPPYESNPTQNPEIASLADGSFVVVWEGYDGSVEGVFGRKLVSSGQLNGGVFRVNDETVEYQGDDGRLDVAADGQGNFSVVWIQDGGSPDPGVHLERFDAQKNTITPAQLVSVAGEDHPRVASLPSGESMVLFESGLELHGRAYDATGLPVGPAFLVSSDASYGGDISAGGTVFTVIWDGSSGPTGRLFDATGAAVGSEFSTTSTTGYLSDVATDADGNFVVAWKESGTEWRAQRFQVEASTPTDHTLLGKVMVLSNKIPDDFEKSLGKWKASGTAVEVPLRGSVDDPRCNGDPVGTVKASARFSSATSGQDTGPIPLPCQNWTTTGSAKVSGVAKRGYKYSDGKREAGPCTSVKLKGTKSISVSCKGKPGAAAFPFDLMTGVSQGVVVGSVTLGSKTYCAAFPPFIDGSDGKKFKGKSLAAPASCS